MTQNLAVISSYPSQGSTHDQHTVGVASYTKLLITALKKYSPQTSITVFAEKLQNTGAKSMESYKDSEVDVKRIWQRNQLSSLFRLWRSLRQSPTQTILVSFEAYMFGNLLLSGLFLLLLAALRLGGKKVVFLVHQLPSNLSVIETNKLKAEFLSASKALFLQLLRLAASKVIVFETGLTTQLSDMNVDVLPHLIPDVRHIDQIKAKKKLAWNPAKKQILYFGYLAPYKGVDWLIENWPQLADAELVIAGGINPNHQSNPAIVSFVEHLQKIAKQKSILVTGFVNEQDIDTYFAAADAVVLPYKTFMSSSGPLALALAHEKPVLLSQPLQSYFVTPDFQEALITADLQSKDFVFDLSTADLKRVVTHLPSLKKYQQFATSLKQSRSTTQTAAKLNDLITETNTEGKDFPVSHTSFWERFLSPQVIILFFMASILLVTFPAMLHLSSHLIGDGGDNYEFFGFQEMAWQNLLTGQYPFAHSNLMRYPNGVDFGYSYDGAFAVLVGAFLIPFFGNIMAYNLTIWVILFVNMGASYLCFHSLSKSKILGIFGAVAYGLSFYVLSRSGSHLNLAFVAGWPLLVYACLYILREKITWKSYWLFSTSLFLIAAGSLQYLLMLPIALLIFVPLLLIFYRSELKLLVQKYFTKPTALAISWIILFFVFYLCFGGFAEAYLDQLIALSTQVIIFQQFKPSLLDLVTPNSYLPTLFQRFFHLRPKSIELSSFFGFIELALLATSLFLTKKKNLLLFSISAFLLTVLTLAIGYQFLFPHFPFRFIAEPQRFVVLLYFLVITVIVLAWSKQIQKHLVQGAFLILTLMLLVERTSLHYFQLSNFIDGHAAIVASLPGTAVFDIPVDPYNDYSSFLPAYYHKKITDGYIHWTGNNLPSLQFLRSGLINIFWCAPTGQEAQTYSQAAVSGYSSDREQAFLDELTSNGINTVVVHKNNKYQFDQCQNVRTSVNLYFPTLFSVVESPQPVSQSFIYDNHDVSFQYNFFFPHTGNFSLLSLSMFPANALPLKATLNGKQITITEKWNASANGSLIVQPNELQNLPVNAGSTLSFQSSKPLNQNIFFGFWYTFTASDSAQPRKPLVQQVFSNDNETVYQLNN